MTAPSSSTAAILARIETKLDAVGEQVVAISRTQAVQEHRLGTVEGRCAGNSEDIKALSRVVERLETTVKIMAAAGGTVATAGGLWMVAQLLGLIAR